MRNASPGLMATGVIIIALFVFALVSSAIAPPPIGHAVPVPTPGPPVILHAHGGTR